MQITDNTDSAENSEFSSKNGEKYSNKKKNPIKWESTISNKNIVSNYIKKKKKKLPLQGEAIIH